MYTYIVEAGLAIRKHEQGLARIESRVVELQMPGRFEKLSILKSLKEIIADAVKQQSKTIVLVGSDKLINTAVSIIAEFDATLGIIPLGEPTNIAKILGIPYGVDACDVLSSRIVKRIDLGKVSNRYFLFGINVPDSRNLTMECDGRFQVSAVAPSEVLISNFGPQSNPLDGQLEVIVTPSASEGFFSRLKKTSYSQASVFPFKKLTIRTAGESLPIFEDGQAIVKTPTTIEVAPKKLKIIVGKQRRFI
jgi:diacylglycerol kinase family enzyme